MALKQYIKTGFAAFLLLLVSCHKDNKLEPAPTILTLKQVIRNIAGTYDCEKFCFSTRSSSHIIDEGPSTVTVGNYRDTVLDISGGLLSFTGNLSAQRYEFTYTAGAVFIVTIDKNFQHFEFREFPDSYGSEDCKDVGTKRK